MPRLPAPENVTASDGTFSDYVAVTWDAVLGAGSYTIYRSPTNDDPGYVIGRTSDLEWDDATALVNVIYWYSVTAMGSGNCSVPSVADSGYLAATPPPPPDPPEAPELLIAALIEPD